MLNLNREYSHKESAEKSCLSQTAINGRTDISYQRVDMLRKVPVCSLLFLNSSAISFSSRCFLSLKELQSQNFISID